jgi:hypothetical protein
VLSEVFAMDPYTAGKAQINAMFANMDVGLYELRGDVRQLKADNTESKRWLRLTGGDVRTEFAFRGTEEEIRIDGEEAVEFSDGQMIFLDFGFQPTEYLEGQFSLNVLGNVAEKRPLEFTYGDRGLPLTIMTEQLVGEEFEERTVTLDDRERVEIYDFSANFQGDYFDAEAFYHTPRYHWGYKGDFFGLVREATDIQGMDVWNSKAPEGIEIRGKGAWDGLTLLGGPEVYWGANPKFIVKYDFELGKVGLSFIHSEDLARGDEAASASQATERQSRQTTLYAKTELFKDVKLELGGIMSATEKVDEVYTRIDSAGNIYKDEIDSEDTFGIKAKLTFPVFGAETYVSGHYAGLVADGGDPLKTYGVTDPSRLPYSGLGNKREYEAGMMMHFGNLMVYPRVMYRDNLIDANPFVAPTINPDGTLNPGLSPRNRDDDPFAVLGNREARSAEVFFTWDPTGATPFYDWDNDWREDAKFAFNFGGNYTKFPTFTDANLFFFEPAGVNASFGRGLPAEEVWTVSSRMVFNPNQRSRYIFNLVNGFDQSTGNPTGGTRDYFEIQGKAILNRKHMVSGYFMKDKWGPYDFYRQFNITYPEQYKIDYAYLLGTPGMLGSRMDEEQATRIGIRAILRTTDANSPAEEFLDGDNSYIFLVVAYFTYNF